MESAVLVGHTTKESGPEGEKSSKGLSPFLSKMGFDLLDLKLELPNELAVNRLIFLKCNQSMDTLVI